MESLPPSVNWHLWPACNFSCRYCFQPASASPRPLALNEARRVPSLLVAHGVSKLTFVGGEPTLCPHLWNLVADAKAANLTTMLVTNGSRISTKDIPRIARDLDHLAVSIDTIEDATARAIGRGSSASARHALRLIEAAKAANMGTKINLVINAENWEEDLRPTLLRAAPDRIKVFRALHVPGVNDAGMRKAAVTDDQWALARDRYASIGAVCEDNEDMIESYAMLDASGRFFQNGPSGYIRSRSILDAPVMDAFREVRMDNRKFVRRGGLYAWTR